MAQHSDGTVERGSSGILGSSNRFKLAVFGFNANGGSSMTSAAGTVRADWPESRDIALAAERAGLDAVIPVGRWRGFGGDTHFNERSFETFTWAAGLGAITERLDVFATFHLPTAHPIRVAKEIATIDHITGGRFALNLVAGWNASEINLFGVDQRAHDDRYDFADEFVEVLKRLFASEEEFDFDGRFFKIPRAFTSPKPIQAPLPPIMSAGVSPKGREFAAKNADINFILVDSLETAKTMVADTKRNARETYGRDIKVCGCAQIVVGDTEKEARDYFDYYVKEKGDWEGVSNLLDAMTGNSDITNYERQALATNMIAGWGATPLVGTAEQVAEGLIAMADSGMDGTTLSWVDIGQGIEHFQVEILPFLVQAGLREELPGAAEVPELAPTAPAAG